MMSRYMKLKIVVNGDGERWVITFYNVRTGKILHRVTSTDLSPRNIINTVLLAIEEEGGGVVMEREPNIVSLEPDAD
jgi:hypothetical protein